MQVTLSSPTQPGATQTLTIHLKPVELGRVEIRIERSADGPTKVELAVERADTLVMLVRDQPHLQQALDQAGVPQNGRTIQFSLAATDLSNAAPGANLTGNTGSSSGGGGQHRPGYPGGGQHRGAADRDGPIDYFVTSRSGIDITA